MLLRPPFLFPQVPSRSRCAHRPLLSTSAGWAVLASEHLGSSSLFPMLASGTLTNLQLITGSHAIVKNRLLRKDCLGRELWGEAVAGIQVQVGWTGVATGLGRESPKAAVLDMGVSSGDKRRRPCLGPRLDPRGQSSQPLPATGAMHQCEACHRPSSCCLKRT